MSVTPLSRIRQTIAGTVRAPLVQGYNSLLQQHRENQIIRRDVSGCTDSPQRQTAQASTKITMLLTNSYLLPSLLLYPLGLKLCLAMFPVRHDLSRVRLLRGRIEQRRRRIVRLLHLGRSISHSRAAPRPPLTEEVVHKTPDESDRGDHRGDGNTY